MTRLLALAVLETALLTLTVYAARPGWKLAVIGAWAVVIAGVAIAVRSE